MNDEELWVAACSHDTQARVEYGLQDFSHLAFNNNVQHKFLMTISLPPQLNGKYVTLIFFGREQHEIGSKERETLLPSE